MFKKRHIAISGALICLTFTLLEQASYAQDVVEISIVSCENKKPLESVFLFNEYKKVLGVSSIDGMVYLTAKNQLDKIRFGKFGYRDTVITIAHQKKLQVCLEVQNFELREIEISVKEMSLHEQLEAYMEKTAEKLLDQADTLNYQFEYTVTVPDSNWTLNMSGIMEFPMRPYDNNYGGAFDIRFCSQVVTDSAFWNSDVISDLYTEGFVWFIRCDGIRKGILWGRIKRKWNISKGIDSQMNTKFEVNEYNRVYSESEIKIIFDQDSVVSSFEIMWFPPAGIWGVRMDKQSAMLSHNIELTYRKNLPVLFDSLYGNAHYKMDNGLRYSIEFTMSLLTENAVINCGPFIAHSMLLELDPKWFREHGIEISYF